MDRFFTELVLSPSPRYRLGRHFLFWFVCWTFNGFIYGFYYMAGTAHNKFLISYTESLIYMPQHMFLSYGIIYLIRPYFFEKEKYWTGFMLVVIFILLTALGSPITNRLFIIPFREYMNYPIKNQYLIFYSFMGGLRGSTTIAGFAVAIKLLKSWHLKKVENEKLGKEKAKAELEILKGQIHPHFMFNTLNSIYSLALKKSDQTPEAILKLSQLMRYMLTECSKSVVDLKTEIEVLQNYVDLEKGRFGDRLDISVSIQGDIDHNKIAPLLLLPFLENSFKHGANEMIEQAWISLDLQVIGSNLKFKLINGRPSDASPYPESAHVGLQNVKKRLALLYPSAHELRIHEDEDSFMVILTLSLDRIKTAEG